MELTSIYIKKRRYFGGKCNFSSVGPHLDVDINPDPELKEHFVTVTSSEKGTQCSRNLSLHTANTDVKPTSSCGMNHEAGGWPADVDPRDTDQVARYKKKIHKDEYFINTIKELSAVIETFIMENNSVDIFEEYFVDENYKGKDEAQFKTLSVYRDTCEVNRKVLNISWALDGNKIAAAYSGSTVLKSLYCPSYVWDIENSNIPYCTLIPDVPLNCVEYSPRDLELLIGGLNNGQIGLWDVRTGGPPQLLTPVNECHKEVVSDIKWISSKTGFEFFSGSMDGKLMYWDARNMNTHTNQMTFNQSSDELNNGDVYNITCMEYDPTSPHRFMLGTEQGTMLSCNRKFKDPSEVVSSHYCSCTGPVLTIERNTFFPKLFASCSTWDVKVWSEDLAVAPILNLLSQDGYVTDVAWSNSNAPFLFVTKTTGCLELWDILVKNQDPILSFKLESDGLVSVHPKQQGEQVACGTANGCIHLLEVPKYTNFSTKHEKNLVSAMIDREGKREKLLEGMTREQRARERNNEQKSDVEASLEDAQLYLVEEDGNRNDIKEFDSHLGSDERLVDEDMDDSIEEVPFFDLQFNDTLKSILKNKALSF